MEITHPVCYMNQVELGYKDSQWAETCWFTYKLPSCLQHGYPGSAENAVLYVNDEDGTSEVAGSVMFWDDEWNLMQMCGKWYYQHNGSSEGKM